MLPGLQLLALHRLKKGGQPKSSSEWVPCYRMPAGNTGHGNVANSILHFGARYDDPTTGRWTQPDPEDHLGSTTQPDWFTFAGGNPLNNSDPNGRGIIKDIFDAASTGYGCFGAETLVGAVFCVGGIYELSHAEIEKDVSLVRQTFNQNLQQAVNQLYTNLSGG